MGPKVAVDDVSVVIVEEAELVRAAPASVQSWMLVLGPPQLSEGVDVMACTRRSDVSGNGVAGVEFAALVEAVDVGSFAGSFLA